MGLSRKELIYGALTFVSLLAAIAKLAYFDGAQRGLQGLVFAVAYLAFVGWAGTELWSIRAREAEDSGAPVAGALEGLANRPSEDVLISAETYLSVGESLDTICRYVEPMYTEWTPSERLRYRQGLRAALDERRSASPPEQTADG